MGFDKPQDLAWIFIVFAIVMVTVGFGIDMVNTEYGGTIDKTYYNTITNKINSTDGLYGTSQAQEGILNGEEGSSGSDSTRDSFILKGFKSLRQLGNTWSAIQDSLDEGAQQIGLDPIYITLIMAGITISFAVILWTWLRGN